MSRKAEMGLITHRSPNSTVAEQYRAIRTNLYFSSLEQGKRSYVITSPGFREGKSTTAANLSISMAQQGKRVLVIDADLRKPTLHATFHSENRIGLTNVLEGAVTLEESITQTDIEGLELVTSGPLPSNPVELLSSQRMKAFLENVVNRVDIVLFDSPPILDVTDASLLAHLCDGVILVLQSGKSQDQMAVDAKRALEYAKAKWIGVILNQKK